MDSAGAEVPEDWGPTDPVGTATSWTCLSQDATEVSGIHVVADTAIRCRAAVCEASTFTIADDETYRPEALQPMPSSMGAGVGPPDAFSVACGAPG